MNYQQPWQILNIDISNALRTDIDLKDMYNKSQYAGAPAGIWHYRDIELDKLLDTNWIKRMHQIGIPVKNAMVFYRDPFYVHPEAHIDVFWSGEPCIAAINWTLDPDDDSEMIWYNTPKESANADITPAETKYLSWPLEQIESYEFAKKTIGSVPTLVRTGIPHNIVVKRKPRWAVSVRYDDRHLKNWENTVDFFKPWILEC